MSRMGRPTEAPKIHGYRVRMTDEDLKILNECAEKSRKSKADVIREGIQLFYRSIKK